MPYILALLGWWVVVFGGVGLLVLSEPLWNPRPARARARAASPPGASLAGEDTLCVVG